MSLPTLAERLAAAARRLSSVTDTPRLDAELLLAHSLGISRSQLLARLNTAPDAQDFEAFLKRRLNYEPIAYILGQWEFYGLELRVVSPLLVPRPETEHLVEYVVSNVPGRVLDLCTGTGCVAVAVAVNAPESVVTAVDINPLAVRIAQENVEKHGLCRRVTVIESDLFEKVSRQEPFDVICANPPYVEDTEWRTLSPVITRHEDPRALLAGKDGLDIVRRIAGEAAQYLKPKGILAFEIGMGQYEAVCDIVCTAGFVSPAFVKDLAGIKRIVTCVRG